MREDLSGLTQDPQAPKRQTAGLDLVALAEDLKGTHPTAQGPGMEQLLSTQPRRPNPTVELPKPRGPWQPEDFRREADMASQRREDYLRHLPESEKYGPGSAALQIALQNLNPDRETANREIDDILDRTKRKALGEHPTLLGAAGGLSEAARLYGEGAAIGPMAEGAGAVATEGLGQVFPTAAKAFSRFAAPAVQDLTRPAIEGTEASLTRRLTAEVTMRARAASVAAARGVVPGAIFGAEQGALEGQNPGDVAKGAAWGAGFGAAGSAAAGAVRGQPTTIFGEMAPGGGGAADPYRVLGLEPNASPNDVKAAYREAALRSHPDVPADVRQQRGGSADPIVAAQQFSRATEAYDTIDKQQRADAETRMAAEEQKMAERKKRETVRQKGEREFEVTGEGTPWTKPTTPTVTEILTGRSAGEESPSPAPPGATIPPRRGFPRRGAPAPPPGERYDYIEGGRKLDHAIATLEESSLAPRMGAEAPSTDEAEKLIASEQPKYEKATGGMYVIDLQDKLRDARALAKMPRPADIEHPQAREVMEHLDNAHAAIEEGDDLNAHVNLERARASAAGVEQAKEYAPYLNVLTRRARMMGSSRISFTPEEGDAEGAFKVELAKNVAGDTQRFGRIAVLRERGATDEQLREVISRHLGEGGRGGPGMADVSHRGGKNPKYTVTQPGGEPVMVQGKKLVNMVRQMFKIPQPGGTPTTEMPTEGEAPVKKGAKKEKGADPDSQVARHAELARQIERDKQIMGTGMGQAVWKDEGAHMGQPGQKFVRTYAKGAAYPARGRVAQAEKRLAALEKEMDPETLQRARTESEAVAQKTAEEMNERLNQGGKSDDEIERAALQEEPTDVEKAEGEPDYERLARMSSSKLGADLRKTAIDGLIQYGESREELEKLGDRELINKALESGAVSTRDETRLLDVLFGLPNTGAVRLGKGAVPIPLTKRTGLVDGFLKLYSPQSRGPEVEQAAESFIREYGEMVRRHDALNERLKGFRGSVDLSKASGIQFMDRAEHGDSQVSPKLQDVADIIRDEYDMRRDLIQEADPEALKTFIEDYMGRVWQQGRQAPPGLQDAARMMAARRPLAGRKGFLKKRTFPDYIDGVAAGKVPVTFDGIDMAKLVMREQDRFIMATRWRRDLTARNLRKFYRSDQQAPEGWVREPEGEVWYRNDAGERVRSGSYYVPEPIAQLEHNVLGPGLTGAGAKLFDAWRTLNNSLTAAILGWSGFHGYMSTMTSAFSRAAVGWGKLASGDATGIEDILAGQLVVPAVTRNLMHGAALRAAWKNPSIDNPAMQQLAHLLAQAGGGFEMPREYQAATIAGIKEAVAQNKLPTAMGRAAALAFRSGSIPILEHYVPIIKYGAWADGARAWLKAHPMASDEETAKALQDLRYQIDNRFGQVRYDLRFWNQTLKQILQATFFAPGWVAGSVEMVTNAMRDASKGRFRSPAVMGLLAMVTSMATINALYQLAATGEGPKDLQDVIEPRDGSFDEFGNPNRVSPATYFKVYAAWFRAAKHLVKGERGGGLGPVPSGLVPAFNIVHELWTNRDYSGNMIRNPQDPAGQQFHQAAKYLVGEWEPLSARNVQEAERRGETGFRKYQPALGMTPASREATRTAAENMMIDMARAHTGARTPEEIERVQQKRIEQPRVTGDEKLIEMFRRRSPTEREQIYAVANEHEKAVLGPYVARRQRAYKK